MTALPASYITRSQAATPWVDDIDSHTDGFSASLTTAMHRGDAIDALDLIRRAGELGETTAVAPLRHLLLQNTSAMRRLRGAAGRWSEVRAQAAATLYRIDGGNSLPFLVGLMTSTDDPALRSVVWSILPDSEETLTSCVGALRRRSDWQLEGMVALLRRLGSLRVPGQRIRHRAALSLVACLADDLPRPSDNWQSPAPGFAMAAFGAVVLISFWLTVASSPCGDPVFGLTTLGVGMSLAAVVGLVTYAVSELTFRGRCCARERRVLRSEAAQALAAMQEVSVLPRLVDLALAAPDSSQARMCRVALHALLPAVRAEDAARLPQYTLNALGRALSRRLPESMILGILNALEKAGSGTSLRAIRHLAECAETAEVAARAVNAAAVIEARRHHAEIAGSLLRGVAAPGADAASLLRIPAGPKREWPEQMLRPVNSTTGTHPV